MALSTHLVHQYDLCHPAPTGAAAPRPGPRKPHTPRYTISTAASERADHKPDIRSSSSSQAYLAALRVESERKQQQYSSKPYDGNPLAFGLHHGNPTSPDHEYHAKRLGTSIAPGLLGMSSTTVRGARASTPVGGMTQSSMFNLPTQSSVMDIPSSAFGGPFPQGTYSAFQHPGMGMGMGMGMGGGGGGFGMGGGGGQMGYGDPDRMMLSSYSASQIATLQSRLSKKLGPEYITQRTGPGGSGKLSYIEGWKVINLANEVFGFNGWSSQIVSLTTDYCDPVGEPTSGRFNVGVSSIIRITLRDGVYHEDVGLGMCENTKGKGTCLEKAKKEAVTDGVKRTLKSFGNLLGNCLYDKDYAKDVAKIKVVPKPLQPKDLWRRPEYDEEFQASAEAGPSRPHPMLAGRNETANGYSESGPGPKTSPAGNRFSDMGPPAPPPQAQAQPQQAGLQSRALQQAVQQPPGPNRLAGSGKPEVTNQTGLTPAQRRANAAGLALERPVSTDYDASFVGDEEAFAAALETEDPSMPPEIGDETSYMGDSFDTSMVDDRSGMMENRSMDKTASVTAAQLHGVAKPTGVRDTAGAAVSGAEMRRLAMQGQASVSIKLQQASAVDPNGSGSSGGSHGSGVSTRSALRLTSGPTVGERDRQIGPVPMKTSKVGIFSMPGSEAVENLEGYGVPQHDSGKGYKRALGVDDGDGFGYPAGNHYVRPETRQTLGELQPMRSGFANPPDPKRYRTS